MKITKDMITKDRVYSLLKTHIGYISIIILVVGLNMRYSLPSFFPVLNKIDIKFFGTILMEFSILAYIGNWLIDRYKEEINEILFSKILDEKLGLQGPPLITELVNIIQPFQYNIIHYYVTSKIVKLKSTQKKYDVIQVLKIKLSPKRDNVHYRFAASTSEENKPTINYIKLNDKHLSLKKDIRRMNTSYLDTSPPNLIQILTPLKKGKIYDIEIETLYPECMDDLNEGKEYDSMEYTYYSFTERTCLKHEYTFPNFNNYEFKAEKKYLNLPDVVEVECMVDKKTKEVIVEAGNLKNGDTIYLTYTKKK